MEHPVGAKLTPDVAAEICERTSSAAVVESSIASLGTEYMLDLRARNCQTGDVLEEEQARAAKKEDILKELGEMANRFGTRAGESLPKAQKEPSLRAEVTTPSQEAWRSFSAAMKASETRGMGVETRSLLKRAVEIDPKFAMAYAYLGLSDNTETAAQNVAKAYALRDQVSDWENYCITFHYHRQVTGNLELARQTLESWAQRYSNDVEAHGLLSAFTSQALGRYEKAVEEGQKAIQLDPNFAMGYINTAWAYVYQNRLAEAEAVLRRASERKIDVIELSLCRYFIAFQRSDRAAMEREMTYRKARFEAHGRFEHQEAVTLAYQGRLKEAAQMWDRAVVLARQANFLEQAALFQGARAVWNALFGLQSQAQSNAAAASSLYRSRDAGYGPAFALALLHESGEAGRIKDVEKRYPDYTCAQFSYLPVLRALEALNRGEPVKALEMTQTATPYELAVPGTAYYSSAFFGGLHPVYVRGLAYSRLGRHREAAKEFQKILDHPGITMNDPIGPMARLQLARALYASGDRAKSAAAYKDLLMLWKDADNDIQVVQEAKAESTR
jgi:tetratricopeptide (TPR) repeat protein